MCLRIVNTHAMQAVKYNILILQVPNLQYSMHRYHYGYLLLAPITTKLSSKFQNRVSMSHSSAPMLLF